MANNIAHANMLFYPLYYDINLSSLKIIEAFRLLHGFAENQGIFWDFKIQNSVWITEGSDNGDLDNRGSTVCIYIYIYACVMEAWSVYTLDQNKPVDTFNRHLANNIYCANT